jgi:hypothetical protein
MAMKLLNTCYVNVKLWQYHGVTFLNKELQQLSHVPVDLFRRCAIEIGLAGK